ncbi:hypothetical protein [Janibacter limosus]|uniref:hypothetical protein n=1 Tax=Janibacter limosus TaxID=53458 RepID=UPI00082D8D69|nr:hypothetical protein [Janibacter limosus]
MTDVTCGDWLLERVGGWGRVGGVAGVSFEAYARVLHPVPASLEDLTITDEWGIHPMLQQTTWRWSHVAERQGLTMHPLVQWNRLADMHQGVDFEDGWQVGQTREGHLDQHLLAALAEHLAGATATPRDVAAGIWNGWGELPAEGVTYADVLPRTVRQWWEGRRARRARAAAGGDYFAWPDREMHLFATSVEELAGHPAFDDVSPQMIWPADHSWVVASEIDWDSTIVAGSRSLVDAVLADGRLEAYEVDEDADLTWDGDLVNPPRAGWRAGP